MTVQECRKIRVIDSHTGGEPTRLVVSGGPDLRTGPLADRLRSGEVLLEGPGGGLVGNGEAGVVGTDTAHHEQGDR